MNTPNRFESLVHALNTTLIEHCGNEYELLPAETKADIAIKVLYDYCSEDPAAMEIVARWFLDQIQEEGVR